ncbi:UNVERIFIED_CONTAM: hypothetical protein K2H54_068265 [Gekko kuhli]
MLCKETVVVIWGSQDLVAGLSQDGPSRRTSIRHLLCDDTKCALCAQAAEEAAGMVYPPGLGLVLPAICDVEPSGWLGLSLPAGQDDLPQRGPSALPLRAASTGPQAGSLPGKQQFRLPPSYGEEGPPCSSEWSWSKVTLWSSFSSISEVSISSRTEGSSSSTQSQGLFRAALLQEAVCEFCRQTESEVSSDSRGQEAVSPERSRRFPSPRREAAPDRHEEPRGQKEEPPFQETSKPQRAGLGAMDTPFTAGATRADLERHLLAKRIQHEMGLPLALLRSLRAFIPRAPALTSGQPARSLAVAPRPQTLPFLSEDSKRGLEQHLRKMVRLKRWGLPQRVREALRHMRPDSRPPGDSASPAGQRAEKACQTTAPLGRDVALQTTPIFQPELPAPQKMAGGEERELPVPQPSGLQGQRDLQPPSTLLFQRKADNAELGAKHRPVRAVPPTQVTSKAPALPDGMRPTPEGEQPPSVRPADLERLELHILRKRLQHHWGLPGLIQQSLRHFLPATPAPRLVPLRPFRRKVRVFLGAGQLRFIPEEARRRLDDHVRRQVTERRWGLPKRVLQSLRAFTPAPPPPRTKGPKEKEKGRVPPTVKRSPPAKSPRPPRRRGVDLSPASSSWQRKYRAVQRHLAKKALEIQLGLFCPMVQRSREVARQGRRRVLPKVAPPGPRAVQPRRQEVPFVDQASLDRIKLNIIHKNLAHRWGLPTLYWKSLARLCRPPPALGSLSPAKATKADFAAVETPFVGQQAREELEWHVRRKQLQHIWGLPGLVQRSLRRLLPATPLRPPRQRTGHGKVAISQQRLSFLSKETEQKLDLNVRKRVILQRWGLPRVVLESLKGLRPEKAFPPLGRRATKPPPPPPPPPPLAPPAQPHGSFPSSPRRRMAAAPPQATLCPWCANNLEKMARHVARKSVEVRLGVLPPVAGQSQRLATLSQRQPLPRLIPRGQRALRPRRAILPFARAEDVDRIEVALLRRRLSSLWGLGLRYAEGLAAMVPPPPSSRLMARRLGTEFQEVPTPFLPRPAREALELSIRKKRLQHEWGLPALIRKSLKAFVEGLPTVPACPRAGTRVNVLPQELSFLPQSILRHLELHVQKMKLHHQWGLPRRVLQDLRALCPPAGSHVHGQQGARPPPVPRPIHGQQAAWSPSAPTPVHGQQAAQFPHVPTPCSYCRYPVSSATGALSTGRSPQPFMLGRRVLGKLRLHVAKKCMEVQLGAFPAAARLSRGRVAFRRPLPKLLLPSPHLPRQPRSPFLPFVRREDVDRIEMAVRHSHLRALWGLGTRYVEAVAGLAPRLLPRPLVHSTGASSCMFSGAETPFLPEQDREALERLVRRKTLQHLWGLPGLVRRALAAFMHKAPSAPAGPKTSVLVQPRGSELPFLSPDLCRALELHIQKMKIQRRWGLPSRVLKSLKRFLPSEGQTRSDSRPQRSPPPPDGGSPSTERSTSPGSRPRKEEARPPHVAPTRSSMPHPALHPATRGSKTPPLGKKGVPHGEGLLRAAQPRGKGRGEQAGPSPFLLRRGTWPSDPEKSDKKLSLIGSILEKKLHLEHGLHTWLRDQERQREEKAAGEGGLRGADHSVRERGTGRWEESQRGRRQEAGSAAQASKRAQGLSPAHPSKLQPFQAGRMKSLVRLEGDSVGSPSGRPSRVSPKGKSHTLALDRFGGRERGRGRGTTPMAKGKRQGSLHRERREQRPNGKEPRSSSEGWSSATEERQLNSKEQRPSSQERRPGSQERRPGSEEQQSRSKERRSRSKERRLNSKEQRPGSKEQTLSTKEQRLSSKEGRPGSEDWQSQSKEQRPGSKERTLSNKEQRPSSKERIPNSQEQRPSSKERRLSSKEQRLSSQEQRPSSKERRLSSKEQRSSSQEWRPSSKEGRLSSKEQRLSSQEQRPSSKERRLSSKEQRSSSQEQRPSSKEGRLSSKEQRSSSQEQRPSSKERRLSSKEQRLSSQERRPSSKEGRPGSNERRPSSKEQRSRSNERGPRSKEQTLNSKEQRVGSKEQIPSSKEQRSSSKERALSSKEERPGSKEKIPNNKEQRSSSNERSKEQILSSKEQRQGSKERVPSSKEQRSSSKERRPDSQERRPGSQEQ